MALFSDALLFPDGNILLFQLLWKGTTDLCHLKMSPAVALSSLIVHDHVTHRFNLKIVCEISHELETRNILWQNIPAAKSPPPYDSHLYSTLIDHNSQPFY